MSNKDWLWVEKYRPSTLEETIIPATIKEQFKSFIEQKQIPNLLLSSPSGGTGKTTCAKALCNELGIKPLFINASMNNSIDDVRMTVVQYATTVSLIGDSTKVVILDEICRMSANGQDALKSLIEEVHNNCRFILTANTKSRIVEPLQSRCVSVDFVYTKADTKALAAQMFKRSCDILDQEGVEYDKRVVASVVQKFAPDNRRILNFLQQQAASGKIDEGVLGKLNFGDSNVIIEAMKAKDYGKVKQYCMDNADQLGDDFYGKLYKALEPTVDGQNLAQAVLILADYQKFHSTVPDRFIHLLAMVTELMMGINFK